MPTKQDRDQLRLITKVAVLYHEAGMVQSEIASTLGLSQARVSRLLSSAQELGIVRVSVSRPEGLFSNLERDLETRYNIPQVHVVDTGGEPPIQAVTSVAAALWSVLEPTLSDNFVIGIDSSSLVIQKMAGLIEANQKVRCRCVVELFGNVGTFEDQHSASSCTHELALKLGAQPRFLRTSLPQGSTPENFSRDLIESLKELDSLDFAVFEIRTPIEVLESLQSLESGVALDQRNYAASEAALGLRLMQDERDIAEARGIIGASVKQIRNSRRRIGIYAGRSKHTALQAVLETGILTTLVIDLPSAKRLTKMGS